MTQVSIQACNEKELGPDQKKAEENDQHSALNGETDFVAAF